MTRSMKQPTINLDFEWARNEQQISYKITNVPYVQPIANPCRTNFPLEGLSSPVEYFEVDGNVEIFMQAACDVLQLQGRSIVVGVLGNNVSNEIVLKIVRVAAANKVAQIFTGMGSDQ